MGILAKRCEGGDCEVGIPYAERVSELLAENGFDPATMKVTRVAMAGPESEAAKKKQMEQTMNSFKHIGYDVMDVKLDGDHFKVGMDVEKESRILLQRKQDKEETTNTSDTKEKKEELKENPVKIWSEDKGK